MHHALTCPVANKLVPSVIAAQKTAKRYSTTAVTAAPPPTPTHLQPCVDLQEKELLGVLINQELNSASRPTRIDICTCRDGVHKHTYRATRMYWLHAPHVCNTLAG